MQAYPEGSLVNRYPCTTSSPHEDAEHILLWPEIMEDGPVTFEREITRNLWHTEMALALFAILPEWSETVKLAHGFLTMLLTNHEHWADGKVGFFLGDRIAIPLANGQQLQDPQLVLAQSFQTLLTSFPASLHPNSASHAARQCLSQPAPREAQSPCTSSSLFRSHGGHSSFKATKHPGIH